VARAIARVFERFDQVGTIHQTHLSLVEEGVEVPVRGANSQLVWRLPTYEQIRRMLSNPVYAGAYVYGRRQVEETLDEALRPKKRLKEVKPEQWHALLKDHHEGYLSWEQYEKNRQCIGQNYSPPEGAGPPREGACLLQGLVLCGRCGRSMTIRYGKGEGQARLDCHKAREQSGAGVCQSFGACRLERAVEELLLASLAPLGMEAMVHTARLHTQDNQAQRVQWEQKIERARYEVQLARRQYDSVDPQNRLVARELERRFEKALKELEAVQADTSERLRKLEAPLNPAEEQQLKAYAEEVEKLWQAPGTRVQERKRIARCLVEKIVVLAAPGAERLKAEVHWKGGEKTAIEVARGKVGLHRYVTDPELVELVRNLAREFSDEQIARILYRKRLKTPKGHAFKAYHVSNVRHGYQIAKGPSIPVRGEDVHTAEEAAELLGVSRGTVIRWVEEGLLRGRQLTDGAPWRIQVRPEDLARLKPADADPAWLPLKGAAQVMGVSQQTVLQKLKCGELEGVRVQTGGRTAWRIHLPKGSCDNQPTLL
jgi:excisionase family DNA binding protein